MMEWRTWLAMVVAGVVIGGCAPSPNSMEPREISTGHLSPSQPVPVTAPAAAIPRPVMRAPVLPPPRPARSSETYTVVVNDVPVKELLFALARDAAVNVDVHPAVQGAVTMNAIDQTLDQILDRIANQVAVRYEQKGDTLVIGPDEPVYRSYRVDYVNLTRTATTSVAVATQVATTGSADVGGDSGGGGGGGGGDGNQSTTNVESESRHAFWETLQTSVEGIVSDAGTGENADGASPAVIINRETGIMLVRATENQHRVVQRYLDQVLASARRQVLIEATIVEVTLNDRYRAGIDFQRLIGSSVIQSSLLGANLGAAPFFLLDLANAPVGSPKRDISITARLLKEFGDVKVLSTPTIMALNNQTAIFKVVQNLVFFDVDSEAVVREDDDDTVAVDTEVQTVPVGLVMSVTPQISGDDEVTLNVRPTITRAVGAGVLDPNPSLIIENRIPEIAVREIESVMRLQSGQIAVLGGLMQDETGNETDGIPGLSEIPGIGEVFKYRDDNYTKSELVVFLRPTVIRSPSVRTDLASFRRYLPENVRGQANPLPSWVAPPGGTKP
ncbi:MAG: pilus (MSHA type) biogenesis protein MshL [Pseudomonadota bacterium]